MAVVLDALCSYTALSAGSTFYILGSGLTAGNTYWIYDDGSPTDSLDPVLSTGVVADSNGNAIFGSLSAVSGSVSMWIHSVNDGNHANRVGNNYVVSWGAGNPSPTYVTASPVLTTTPGNAQLVDTWTAATACDARGDFVYAVRRDTFSPPTTNRVTGLTVLTYTDSPLTNGTTYFSRLAATLRIYGTTVTTALSNITSAVPAAATRREIWGAIAL